MGRDYMVELVSLINHYALIILYNSEIWYMEDYYYIYKAENRSKAHGNHNLSFINIYC
jgi:hypothetical protein